MGVTIDGSQGLDTDNTELTLEVGGSEKARIDSSGNLLVGKTTADSGATVGVELRGDVDKIYVTDSASSPLSCNRLASDGNIIVLKKDNTTVGNIGNDGSNLYIERNANSGLLFGSYQILPRRNGSLINNTVSLGNTSYTFADGYFGGGVYLGGTGSANYLDDYEEGTFTPYISFSGGTTGITYSDRGAKYTKVGDMVTVWIYMRLSNKGSSTGQIRIEGLPFVTGNSGVYKSVFSPIGDRGYLNTGGEPVSVYLQVNSSYLPLYSGGFDGGVNAAVLQSAAANNTEFDVVVSYPVS